MAWTYEQKFNSLNDGPLDGQDSWSQTLGTDTFNVTQNDSPYEGAKHCLATYTTSGLQVIKRDITAVTSGIVYVSVKVSKVDNANGGLSYFRLQEYASSSPYHRAISIYTQMHNATIAVQGAVVTTIKTGTVANTYYRVGIEFDCSTDKYKANVDGGTWTGWLDFYETVPNGIDQILLMSSTFNNDKAWFDFISPNYDVVYSDTFTGDANLKKTEEDSFTGNAYLWQPGEGSFTSDSYLKWGRSVMSAKLVAASSQYLSIADGSQTGLDLGTGDFTVMGWFKFNGSSNWEGMVIKRKNGAYAGYQFFKTNTNAIQFYISDSANTCTVNSSSNLSAKTWHHIAMIKDGNTLRTYIDGTANNTGDCTSVGNLDNVHQLCIGSRSDPVELYYDGNVDEVTIWNKKLTPAEVSLNYNSGCGNFYAGTETNLQGYWRFDNDLTDETSNGNTLTNNNGAVYTLDAPCAEGAEFTSDAFIESTHSATFKGDANFRNTFDTPVFGDANLKRVLSDQFNGDAYIRRHIEATFSGDAYLYSAGSVGLQGPWTYGAMYGGFMESSALTISGTIFRGC